ncbi:MAG: transglutaminase-like domain-containing protein, partial [Candidatus Fonsibacter sp.]
MSKAGYLEDYFSNSGEVNYTLSLTGPKDRNLDPITDFIVNKKRGHCQYFASSLALLLRSYSIPTRLVIGFRPNEYND